ncbi:Hypothetical protein PSEBR_m1627 [Pseudomonas brassicacearum subsp. brassicacearum NFM421]|uniref:Uncharacterized protein n=1 Tax=Pseudomonas brassicacearum (strain NFM421) TaxID=994484 RepID=F2KMA9_PSEBN|nr:Hypothetical protein PSEBR_m1627 [Pseudomonas brassicacearum subsp. brassicacearum NFM421]
MTTHRFPDWNARPCGSELARDDGITADRNVECNGLIASKLAPTRGFGQSLNS